MRQAGAKVDRAALIALAATAVGWFFMATLVVDFKWWQDSIRFYDLWAVIQDPGGRLSGIRRVHALTTAGFGLVCAAAILAPALSILYKRKDVWPTYLIPFVVMAISCAVLYARSSTNYIHVDANTHPAGAVFARIAQAAVTRAGNTVATRISIGAGAYVATLCSVFLALRGLGRFRQASRRQRDAGPRQIES
jgi:hypothetical protein